MDLIFVTNARFTQNKKNETFGIHTSINKNTFVHYLKVYSKVYVVGRVEITDDIDYSKAVRLDSERISVLCLPYFVGLKGYLVNDNLIRRLLKDYLKMEAAVILRLPGSFGRIAAEILKKQRKPFGVEVTGDPWDLFAPKAFKHPFRILLRYQGYYSLKRAVSKSSAAIYVTKHKLQTRYPTKKSAFSTYASNVNLKKEDFVLKFKTLIKAEDFNLISIGTLDQMYKGADDLLEAIYILKNTFNLFVNLKWAGEGKYKNAMIELTQKLHIDNQVEFVGSVKPKQRLIKLLDENDLFVLASRTEGLPRALIEAMSRGLPCVSTNVGGVSELLGSEVLVSKNDPYNLAKKLKSVLMDKDFANKIASDNLEKSHDYEYGLINERRIEFYNEVKLLTNKFLDE